MGAAPTITSSAATTDPHQLHGRVKKGYFLLEGINALATAYYLSYLFFYTEKHFGFGNRDNLLLTSLHGFTYIFSASSAGWLAHKFGYLRLLRVGFCGLLMAMVIGGLVPHFFSYTRPAMFAQLPILVIWTISMCFTWPTLQALLSRHAERNLPQLVGAYNVIWSGCSAISFLTGGALLDRFGGETLFWLPAGLHLVQLIILVPLTRWQKLCAVIDPGKPSVPVAAPNPAHLAKARSFLRLAWIANPVAYTAMYGLIPVIPKLSDHLGLTATYAGIVCSVWYWARLSAFAWFWVWPGWHYRFRWLLTAFLAMIASFIVILLSPNVWTLVVSQIVFGFAVCLIYYSSLFYSMDAGVSQGKGGGIHEAAIGLGIFLGPTAGAAGLYFFKQYPTAGIWNITALLTLGLLVFLLVRIKYRQQN